MAASAADVRRIAPELAALSDADVQAFLDAAALEVSASFWGPLYVRAVALVAAHLAGVANPALAREVGEGVASESVGSVSRSYAVTTRHGGRWSGTRHGEEYARLIRTRGPAARVV